jgi:putative endonuclease
MNENRDSALVWGASINRMKFFVYILESEIDGSFYIGQTSNLDERLKRHNKGHNPSTKTKRPWKLIHYIECVSRVEAMKLEKRLISWKKREAIQNFINNGM